MTRTTSISAAALVALLVGCGTADDNVRTDAGQDVEVDAERDVSDDTLADVDADVSDANPDAVDEQCPYMPDLACCFDSSSLPTCGPDGWFCQNDVPVHRSQCADADVGRDVSPSDVGSCDETSNAGQSETPVRTVSFSLNNTTDAVQYVVVGGQLCGGYRVGGPNGTVQQNRGWECLCECSSPGGAFPSEFAVIAPGTSLPPITPSNFLAAIM